MNANAFVAQLRATTRRLQRTVETELLPLSDAALNHKPSASAWSVLECLEHLNRYSRYYHPVLTRAVARQESVATSAQVRYSWLGRKSLAIVRPDNGRRHKTVRHMNPAGSQLSRAGLEEFRQHLKELLGLLDAAPHTDLNRKAVPVEFFRLLKLRTGEALEFVVLHAERHVQQAVRASQSVHAPAPLLSV
ncbi:DinB family protein [Hymenobacter sp. CRA2]|uniref:DinB family protein n=1 Tax=Hymenobacter sp. CRA2 TaxID=1955620 RepID=UPI00098EEE60|nr:DinB family protein [Hymenobacter sp. CRA2]OON70818.1 hypothetical protein B0919_02060 [Hymenobacter sp. CRA2]